ncbi:hypothetical protein Y1Q_0021873 [Alligator mississippiensis]|uniref:Uncharacterized protein n=1 Tax=Alligator mississippiensis TaxID=8496 RepID=A0A151MPA4_ALLMI|nr:hypothetical protein Y1Q_0021873 [Alligator mississippiensis]
MKAAWRRRVPSARHWHVHSDLELALAIQEHEGREEEEEEKEDDEEEALEAERQLQGLDEAQFGAALRDIDADVPRTHRHRTFFQ